MPGILVSDGGLIVGAAGALSPDTPPAGGLDLGGGQDGIVWVWFALPAGGLRVNGGGVTLS